MKNVLVTGASGFLGGRLARLLAERGFGVRAGYLPGDSLLALHGLDVETAPADLLDEKAVARSVEEMDAVLHAAALVSFRPRDYPLQMRVNREGTRNLLTACRRAGVKRVIFTSTVNTLGVPPAGELGDEDTPYDWEPWRLGYMHSKQAAESDVMEAARAGLDAVCLLPGTMFGPGDVNFNAGAYLRAASRELLRLAPPGGTSVVHVDDVAAGHLLALERGRRGERYVLGGEPVGYAELFGEINRLLGKEPPLSLPRLPFRALERLGRSSLALLSWAGGMARASGRGLFYSSARAERELGWTHRPWREGVRDALRWYSTRGMM